jgi:hypothetical protein
MWAACGLPHCTMCPVDTFVNFVYCKKSQQFGWFDVPLTVVFHMCPMNQTTIFVVAVYQKRLNILGLDCDC